MIYKIQINFEIKFKSRFHIGADIGGELINKYVVRDHLNRPYIPGSSLKGIIRENCEKIASTLNFKNIVCPNNPNIIDNFGDLKERNYIIDRLFGNRYEGDKLFFFNSYIKEDINIEDISIAISRNQRERLTGVTSPHCLYTLEEIMPLNFNTKIKGYHKEALLHPSLNKDGDIFYLNNDNKTFLPFEYCILISGILLTDKLGGKKSCGLGELEILKDSLKIKINDKLYDNNKILNHVKEALDSFIIFLEDEKKGEDVLEELSNL